MNGPLEREYEFYLRNRDEFVQQYDGKFIAIKNEKVIGVYADYLEASADIYPDHDYGSVLMQPVQKEEHPKIVTAHSVVT